MCKKYFVAHGETGIENSLDQHSFFDVRTNTVVIVRIGQIMNSVIPS